MNNNLSLYLHFPFCKRKCRYCDFLSFPVEEIPVSRNHASGEERGCFHRACADSGSFPNGVKDPNKVIEAYASALIREIVLTGRYYKDRPVISVFFGGGTPSIMAPDQIGQVMGAIRSSFQLTEDCEITMECNPGTVNGEKLAAMRAAGINRISFGLQSMQDEELSYIGRIHRKEDFLKSYEAARAAGFNNINVDLMSALPGQSRETYLDTLKQVLALRPMPEHISAYSLIIEEGTPFGEIYGKTAETGDRTGYAEQSEHANQSEYADLEIKTAPAMARDGEIMVLPLPDEDAERQMYYDTKACLSQAGFTRYEISNYAREGFACRHNKVYWQGGDYLGLGLGASGKIGSVRTKHTEDLQAYIRRYGADQLQTRIRKNDEETTMLSRQDRMEEFMFLGLRMMEGVSIRAFAEQFGAEMMDVYGDVIRRYTKMGLLEMAGDRLRLTDGGIDVSNVIMAEFLL